MATSVGDKDILFGCLAGVEGARQHIGNRVFRQVIDLNICDFVAIRVGASEGSQYKGLIGSILSLLGSQGYRFIDVDHRGNFRPMDETSRANQVGQALRERAPFFNTIINQPLKTKAQLKNEQICLLKYAEHLVLSRQCQQQHQQQQQQQKHYHQQRRMQSQEAPAGEATFCSRAVAEPLRKSADAATNQELQAPAASATRVVAAPTPPTNDNGRARSNSISTASKKAGNPPKRKSRNSKGGITRDINEIVVPAMKHGNLPYGGYWKFFPLPEVQEARVDLGESTEGWVLKLEPISVNADPITLDIV